MKGIPIPGLGTPIADVKLDRLIEDSVARFEKKLNGCGLPSILIRANGWLDDYRKELIAIAEAARK